MLPVVVSDPPSLDVSSVGSILDDNPAKIPSLLRRLHASKRCVQRCVLAECLAILLNQTGRQAEWHALAESGLKSALLEIVSDEFLCGYTAAELSKQYSHNASMQVRYLDGFEFT